MHNRYPGPQFEGSPTAPRFSLANREMMRLDMIQERSVRPKRVISYPAPDVTQKKLRDGLAHKGLLLGVKQPDEHSGFDNYVIPNDARPISHEARTEVGGGYTYNDEMLFGDLGYLLGSVAKASGNKTLVLDEDIGRNVAIMEFTKPNQQKILLVPGFETQIKTVDSSEQALNCYAKRLYDEFDSQFDHHATAFLEGFKRADT